MKTVKTVGIAGGAASGKSTLARHLAELLGPDTKTICLDDYFITDMSQGPFVSSVSNGQQYFDMNSPGAIDVNRASRTINDIYQHNQTIQYLLIEGNFALHFEELLQKMDLKVFVWASDDVRLGRKIVRNHQTRQQDPAVTLRNYLESGKPGHDVYIAGTIKNADVVLHGEKAPEDNAKILAALVQQLGKSNSLY